jgi:hypothetical protein
MMVESECDKVKGGKGQSKASQNEDRSHDNKTKLKTQMRGKLTRFQMQ